MQETGKKGVNKKSGKNETARAAKTTRHAAGLMSSLRTSAKDQRGGRNYIMHAVWARAPGVARGKAAGRQARPGNLLLEKREA